MGLTVKVTLEFADFPEAEQVMVNTKSPEAFAVYTSSPLVDLLPSQSPLAAHDSVFADDHDIVAVSLTYISEGSTAIETVGLGVVGGVYGSDPPPPPPPPHEETIINIDKKGNKWIFLQFFIYININII